MALRLGLIGFGALGQEIAGALDRLGERAMLAATLVRPGRVAPNAVHDTVWLRAAQPGVVIECAGHGAVHEHVEPLLDAGIDVILSSVGTLSDDRFARRLLAAERRGGGRLLLAAGAVAGLDGLAAAAICGIDRVCYTSLKPPHAWRGTAAESWIDLDHPEAERTFFEGSAREAAAQFPKNANVAMAVALCGLGPDATRVRLVSSRAVNDPLGIVEADGRFGRFRFEILALAAPSNPKSSALTAYSLLQAARLGNAIPIAPLATAWL